MATPEKKKTSMGMEENVESGLSYLGFFVTGLIFYFNEKNSKAVRFNAFQSMAFSVVAVGLWISVSILNFIFDAIHLYAISFILSFLLWVGILIVWIILMVKGFTGGKIKLPVIGDFSEKHAK